MLLLRILETAWMKFRKNGTDFDRTKKNKKILFYMGDKSLIASKLGISDLGSKMKGRKFMCDLNNLRCLYLDMKKKKDRQQ